MHVEIIWRRIERLCKSLWVTNTHSSPWHSNSKLLHCIQCKEVSNLAGEEGHARSVDPGVVGCGSHALEVFLALWTLDASASQLSIVDCNFVSCHRLLHFDKRVCGDLMAEAATATVNHHAHLTYENHQTVLTLTYTIPEIIVHKSQG